MQRLAIYFLATALLLGGAPLVFDAPIQGAPKAPQSDKVSSQFDVALRRAETAIENGDHDIALVQITRALERDPKSPEAWGIRASWAEAIEDTDELVYALHKQYRLLVKQGMKRRELEPLRTRLETADPLAQKLLDFRQSFIDRLLPLAERYEKEGRPHSAIRVHREILSLDPEREASKIKIEEISASPDPTLAATAKPKDLLEGISQEWIRKHDQKHREWSRRAVMEKPNYITQTNAGYAVLVRTAEAMEQMNGFYREWFQYPQGGPRIYVNIFKDRDEYLKLGIGPPVEWSGGHFTGSAVETYIAGSFENTVGTLFHEAAHQFVSLATTATGWLNEGIASFFEGTRILSNGTVEMNLPANHRLFPLANRMENGWMTSATDGIDSSNPSGSTPTKAPTFQIIIENEYSWGPPWYAPTWGFVYFLYNYQDPVDGRFVYRAAFQDFIDSSGGRVGKGAIENFEKTVVRNPSRRTPGVDFKGNENSIRLPREIDELNEIWKEYTLELRDEQTGRKEVARPYHDWAKYALKRKEKLVAKEHFEKGILRDPFNVDLLVDFGEFLVDFENNKDRASKLVLLGIQVLENAEDPDEDRIADLERLLLKWDPKRRNANKIRGDLRVAANELAQAYFDAELYMMCMDVSLRFGREFRFPELFDLYEAAARKAQKSLALWRLAYNEVDLEGWDTAGNDVFQPYGSTLRSSFGEPEEGKYDFRFLTMKVITSGDFSMETEIRTEYGENSFAGLVFGNKDASSFHALLLYPGGTAVQTGNFDQKGYVDLTTFYGAGDYRPLRHNAVDAIEPGWHTLRLDITGSLVDVWWDGVPLVTHEFPSIDVLRGRFGLITGPGAAQFRNVRYLAREPRDPASLIERTMRMEKYGVDGSVSGSWLGRVPPFPEVMSWLSEPRVSWRDKGGVPTLLVFWSPQQNDLVRLDEWLRDLAKRYADVGLEIVSVCAADDASGPITKERARTYLETHRFPGAVAIDAVDMRKGGFGVTFENYGINATGHYLPRLALLDVDHKVIWEGDPGFELGKPWRGEESYVETPLKDLVQSRMLRRVAKWRSEWLAVRDSILGSGDFERLAPYLIEASSLPTNAGEEVQQAQAMLRDVESLIDELEDTAEAMYDAGAAPAVDSLVRWSKAIGRELDMAAYPVARGFNRRPSAKEWTGALKSIQDVLKRVKPGKEEPQLRVILAKLEPLDGRFPQVLRERIAEALELGDIDRALDIARNASTIPTKWLTEQIFGQGT